MKLLKRVNLKNKALKLGLLLVTLLFVFSFTLINNLSSKIDLNNDNDINKVYAEEGFFEEGYQYTLKVEPSASAKATFEFEMDGDTAINFKSSSRVVVDGDEVSGSTVYDKFIKAYFMYKDKPGSERDEKVINCVDFFVRILQEGGLISQSDRTREKLLAKGGDIKDTDLLIPLVKNFNDHSYVTISKTKITDEEEEEETPEEEEEEDDVENANFKLIFDIGETQINVIVQNSQGRDYRKYKFATVDSANNTYTEIKYNNSALRNLKINHDGDGAYITPWIVGDDPAGLNMFYTTSGKTIDDYYSIISNTLPAINFNEPVLVLSKSNDGNEVVLYYGYENTALGNCRLHEAARLDCNQLKSIFDGQNENLSVGDWIIEPSSPNSTLIVAYKEGQDKVEEGYYYDFSQLKKCYIKDDDYFDLIVSVKKGKASSFSYSYPRDIHQFFCLIRCSRDCEKKGDGYNQTAAKAELASVLADENEEAFALTCTNKQDNAEGSGKVSADKFKVSDTYHDGDEPQGKDYPPEFPLSEMLMKVPEFKSLVKQQQSGLLMNADLTATLGAGKEREKKEFLRDLFFYGRAILLFLILLALIYTAILSIQSATDVDKRVLIKTRIKNILTGAIIFSVAIPMFGVILAFSEQSFVALGNIADTYQGPTFYTTKTRFQTGWLVNLIGKLVRLVAQLSNWLVDELLRLSIEPGRSVNVMNLIYGVYDDITGEVSSLLPFSATEWSTLMVGYRLLSVLAICLLSMGVVKLAGDYILNAGNYEKIARTKEQIKNFAFTILGVVVAPYAIRLLFLLFNYLTAMLPINGTEATFEFSADDSGFVGSICNLDFALIKLRIFITFFVRKIMLGVLLLASPVVLSAKCISDKFRGYQMWIGELLAQVSIQFCYALVMLVVILITYDGQSPFMVLISITLLPRFAQFFSKSLQGFAQRWSGAPNADQIANRIIGGMKKAKGTAKRAVNGTGKTLIKASKFFDKDGVSKTGRNVHNVGALLSGQPLNMRTKREMYDQRAKVAAEELSKSKDKLRDANANMKPWLSDEDVNEYKEAYEEAMKNGTPFDKKTGTGYDEVNDYFEAKSDVAYNQNRYDAYTGLKNTYATDATYGEGNNMLGRLAQKAEGHKALQGAINAVNYGPMSSAQRWASGYKKICNEAQNKEADIIREASGIKFVNAAEVVTDITNMQALAMDSIKSGKKIDVTGTNLSANDTLDKIKSLLDKDGSASLSKLDAAKELIQVVANFEQVRTGSINSDLMDKMSNITQSYEQKVINQSGGTITKDNLSQKLQEIRQSAVEDFTRAEKDYKYDVTKEEAKHSLDFDPTSTTMGFGDDTDMRFADDSRPGFGMDEQITEFGEEMHNPFNGEEEPAPGETIIHNENNPKGTQRQITGYSAGPSDVGVASIAVAAENSGEAPDMFIGDDGDFNDDAFEEIEKQEKDKGKDKDNAKSNETKKTDKKTIDDLVVQYESKKNGNEQNAAADIAKELMIAAAEFIQGGTDVDLSSSDFASAKFEGESRKQELDKAIEKIQEVYPEVTAEYIEAHAEEIIARKHVDKGKSQSGQDNFKASGVIKNNMTELPKKPGSTH